ncbi:MAG TPA: c-type cytochrome [Burkholderiaceae bacterium]|nr:c-type cytochrome [Burkholderiaceae bacterium]
MSRLRTFALLLPLAWAAAAAAQDAATPAFRDLDSVEARVQGCVTCHGQSGQGTQDGYYPRIAGKPAGYLYNQLVAFRDDDRRYPPMNYLVAYLPDAYLHEIADYFSKLRPELVSHPVPNPAPAVVARGAELATKGDLATGVPACVSCHGARLTGMEPGVPGLTGLRPTYVTAQLTRWRTGDRHAPEPDCMKRVATRLSDPDIAAVATWLSLQPPPRDLAPAKANIDRMPFACGSQEARK